MEGIDDGTSRLWFIYKRRFSYEDSLLELKIKWKNETQIDWVEKTRGNLEMKRFFGI